ncbi:DUF1800 domain-containing protein [Falsirhodobacter halotolerans]|uniref:DUF1800 domain-containing protein n=1 Tax=Falsirhodobacter halotolerans TaxID=1146892 RepID=UPI001FD26037|nr:DUF1800 family protein [Falsirhodobacter halotolerans]MCJ8140785.1 DUF1800 domain-containing protein [Falsirhodobacter halotolerans]
MPSLPFSDMAALRFGHGLSPRHAAPADAAAMLLALDGPDAMRDRWPMIAEGQGADLRERFIKTRQARRTGGEAARRAHLAVRNEVNALTQRSVVARFGRILDAPDTFRERLHQFWADHFTTSGADPSHRATQLEHVDLAIRPHITGRFADLLLAADTHRMMLMYLDQSASRGPNSPQAKRRGGGVNENLAREAIELHTLGVGAAYTQDDVRQLALLLTGMGDDKTATVFRRDWAEPGAETVLGRTYGGPGRIEPPIRQVFVDLARHPDTARHLARKLAVHFVADTPEDDLVEAMAAAYAAHDTALMPVYEVLLTHPAAQGPVGAKARQPFDWLATAMRGLGVDGATLAALRPRDLQRHLILPMTRMGQRWQVPPGPDGWPEGMADWLTPPGLAERIGWAMSTPAHLVDPLPDPRALVEAVVPEAERAVLARLVPRAEQRSDGVALVLASPGFNTR